VKRVVLYILAILSFIPLILISFTLGGIDAVCGSDFYGNFYNQLEKIKSWAYQAVKHRPVPPAAE
jgi:uncharacterized BrkB/YihY/UPF0761 family membrane protein